jgi:hypothetical protein
MNEEEFWRLIELLDWSRAGDDQAVCAPVVAALSEKSVPDFQRFTDLMGAVLYAIDTREHARYGYLGEADPDNGDDYISPDDFLYLRCAVVANGHEYYQRVLADPSQMPQDMEFEALLYVDDYAYLAKTGEDYDYDAKLSYESFSNTEAWTGGTHGTFTGEDIPPGNRRPVDGLTDGLAKPFTEGSTEGSAGALTEG